MISMRFLPIILLIFTGHPLFPHESPSLLSEQQELLRISEPTSLIVADLQQFIPSYMEEKEIPGCAVALIQNHKINWYEGFGVTNSLTDNPVKKEDLFEVASNSKIITAYLALRLVTLGRLSLDTPLNSYLAKPWFPESVYRDSVTLRHILSHSSGLGHNERGKEIQFKPGSGFYYSNQGYSFLQEVIEEVMGGSLETVAIEHVFSPLRMEATSYVNRKDLRKYTVNGHIDGGYIAGISAVLWLVSILLTGLPGIILLRIIRKRWIPCKREIRTGLMLWLATWLLAVFLLFGLVGWLKYAWLMVCSNFALASFIFMLLRLGGIGMDRLKIILNRRRRVVKGILAIIVTSVVILIFARMPCIPVPKWSRIRPMAEASLRTNVHDMAALLLELADPVYLSGELSRQLKDSQISLHRDMSWGLGTGILHTSQGDALWQWGQNVDFQSVTIIFPDPGFGVVVFTNSDWDQPDVAIEIANRALGGNLDPVKRAAHLEYNMHMTEN